MRHAASPNLPPDRAGTPAQLPSNAANTHLGLNHAESGSADRASIAYIFLPSLTSAYLRPEVLHFILGRALV